MTEHDKVAVRREPKKRSSKPKAASEVAALAEPTEAPALPEPGEAPAASAASAAPEPSPVESAPVVEPKPTFVHESAPPPPRVAAPSYTVVARRYRPQRFEDVVGQDHVVQSLKNAIRLNRIAQAYLFSGTRGVGKTSIARIFAKCLNCAKGPTTSPCQTCDICQAIAVGQDVDVIEIDGASNNGVEQVRELRQNASLRPSRCRYKIYYIDEVHMLSTGAFNALLKTLEEPPSHVKFLFATTEPNKIPITVLSRCQRYDFAGITPEAIAGTLGEICTREGMDYEPEALHVVARRAGGSLRDAQSLLDRLLASGSPKLSVDVVHSLLGTASDERLLGMLEALANHDAAAALGLLEQSAGEGVQPADLLGGLIDLIRDAMMLAVGAETVLLAVSPRNRGELKAIADRWTIQPLMASVQILGECRARMRGSVYGRLLLEVALVRIARLEELTSLSELVERLAALESGTPPLRRPDSGSVKVTASMPEAKAPAIAQPPAPIDVAAPARPAVMPARAEAASVPPGEPAASPPSEASQVTQAPPVRAPISKLKRKNPMARSPRRPPPRTERPQGPTTASPAQLPPFSSRLHCRRPPVPRQSERRPSSFTTTSRLRSISTPCANSGPTS